MTGPGEDVARRPEARPVSRELLLRIGSACVIVPAFVLLAFAGEAAFAAAVAVVAVVALFEWLDMLGLNRPSGLHVASGAVLALVGLAALVLPMPAALTVLCLFALLAGQIGRATRLRRPLHRHAGVWTGLGILYTGLPVIAFVAIREGGHGIALVFFVAVTAAAADTMAFFVGRSVGGPKLWRRISPGKTWSGLAGGVAGGLVAGLLVAAIAGLPLGVRTAALAAVLALVSAGGDLLESAIKRHFKIKDASRLIPGHGGVMDRVDGIAAAGVAAVLLAIAAGPGLPPSESLLRLMGGP